MNEMRKLMETVGNVNEGYFSRIAAAADDTAFNNSRLPADELIKLIRTMHGDQAAAYMSDKLASGESIEEDDADPYDNSDIEDDDSFLSDAEYEMVTNAMAERGHEPHSLGVNSKGQLHVKDDLSLGSPVYTFDNDGAWTIEYEPGFEPEVNAKADFDDWLSQNPFESVEEDIDEGKWDYSKRDKGKGAGTDSPMYDGGAKNRKNRKAFRKAEKAKAHAARMRGELDEAQDDKFAGGDQWYTNTDFWRGQSVKIIGGEYRGETGKVIAADQERMETGSNVNVFKVKLYSGGPVITLYLDEWSNDQLELQYDPTHRPDGMYNPELEEDSIDETVGRVVEVPPELRGDIDLVANATSEDARKFLADLGPDDDVSHDVVDPETGELLDWPTAGLNRDEREDREDAEHWRTRGGTKRQKGKRAAKNRDEFYASFNNVPMLHFYNQNTRFGTAQENAWDFMGKLRSNSFYNIVWREVSDLVDDPDEFYDKDYDVSQDIPVVLKRKDGQRLEQDDHDNIKEIIAAVKASSIMNNIGLGYAGTSDEGTTARFFPSFM